MPPHCDSKDGPVVTMALSALDSSNPDLIAPYVPEESEDELRSAFARAMSARVCSAASKEVADEWFCETVVRLHRAGERAPFTGLKPAGLGHGAVVPVAEEAITSGDASELIALLTTALTNELVRKFDIVMELKAESPKTVAQAREYVEAMLGFEVWSHKTHQCIISDPLHDHGSMR